MCSSDLIPIDLHPYIRSAEACYLSSSRAIALAEKTGALQVSGGLLLLLVSLELLTDSDKDSAPSTSSTNAALVPLGTPLLAGPGAIVAAMVAVESASTPVIGWVTVTLALLATHVVIWASLRFSVALHRLLGDTAIRVLIRILGLLLAAIAVQMIGDGVVSFVKESFL